MNKISQTWNLMRASWGVLNEDKRLLVFPLLSGVCWLLVVLSFLLPIVSAAGHGNGAGGQAQGGIPGLNLPVLFLFYFCSYFVIVFFNTALVACAIDRLRGGTAGIGDGFKAAAERLPQILGWALVSATVGIILRIIEERSEKVGRIVAGLLGMAWTVVSFLVIPVLVAERKGPFASLGESTRLLKRTWGEQLVGNFSFGLLFFLLGIPGIGLIVLAFFTGNATVFVVCLALAAVYLVVLGLIQATLQAIFQSAVYLYAHDGAVPAAFDADLLQDSVRTKE